MEEENQKNIFFKIHVDEKPSSDLDLKTLYEQTLFNTGKFEDKLSYLEQLNNFRKTFAIVIFIFVEMSFFGILYFIYLESKLPPAIRLSDKVLISLISLGSIQIVGLLYALVRYLFDRKYDHLHK